LTKRDKKSLMILKAPLPMKKKSMMMIMQLFKKKKREPFSN
jgi:hypothetical protein